MKFGKICRVECVEDLVYIAIIDSICNIGSKPFLLMLNHDDAKFYINLDNVISITYTE